MEGGGKGEGEAGCGCCVGGGGRRVEEVGSSRRKKMEQRGRWAKLAAQPDRALNDRGGETSFNCAFLIICVHAQA